MKTIILCSLFLLGLAVQAVDYNVDVSKKMRMYSLIAHCTQQQIYDWKCHLCKSSEQLVDIQYFQNKQTQIMGYGGYLKTLDILFFVFRGTINATNWVQDFAFLQVNYPPCKNCKVHQGFYLSFQSVATQFYSDIRTLRAKYPNQPLVITGASLGGALATIASIQVSMIGETVSQLHTYGCPRVGNQQFAMFVKTRVSKILRVVHNRDIVPHVPLLNQNYYHLPYEVLFDQQMLSYRICDESGEDSSCSDAYYPQYVVEDHLTYWVKLDPSAICAQ